MVSRHHEDRGRPCRRVHQRPGPLQLPVTRPLRQVPRHHDRVGPQVGNHLLEPFDLLELRHAAEVKIGQVQQLDGHDSACTV